MYVLVAGRVVLPSLVFVNLIQVKCTVFTPSQLLVPALIDDDDVTDCGRETQGTRPEKSVLLPLLLYTTTVVVFGHIYPVVVVDVHHRSVPMSSCAIQPNSFS